MTRTRRQTNSDGDVLIWWHSSKLQANVNPDETPEAAGTQECATCDFPVDMAGAYWHCTDNAEVTHEACDLPDW